MVKLNGLTKHYNNTYTFIATINKTIGIRFFPLLNSPTTILLVLPPVFLRSLQTKVIICTSPSIPNVISPHLELKILSLILMNSTKNSNPSSPQLNIVINVPLIPVACHLQTLLLVSKHLSKQSFSAPPAHPRNFQKSS